LTLSQHEGTLESFVEAIGISRLAVIAAGADSSIVAERKQMTSHDGTPRRRRVAIVRHSFYPSELNVKREAAALLAEDFEVHVVCLRKPTEAAHEVIQGVRVHRLPVAHKRGRIRRYLFEYNAFLILASIKLLQLHAQDRLCAVQVNTMPDYLVFATLALKLSGTKVVLHMHEPMPELFGTLFGQHRHGWLVRAIRLAERLSVAYADRVLTVTEQMREKLGERGANIAKVGVIVNVPDDRLFALECYPELVRQVAAIKHEDNRNGIFRLLCHGAIERRYGLELIVEAVALVVDKIPGVQFRFMGEGDYLGEVLARARELGVASHVHYLGYVSFEKMIEEILATDVAIVPMRRNPYSVLVHTNKMYEYMALKRPIIASRLGAVASYFPENTLLYFTSDDAEDLARQILYAADNPEEMSARTRRVAALYEAYRWEHEKRKYVRVYHDLVGSGGQNTGMQA
jgi:glycosyltransferase involved in cell wall biosynthesis